MTEESILLLVDALAWPITVAIIVVALRKSLGEVIQAVVATVLSWF